MLVLGRVPYSYILPVRSAHPLTSEAARYLRQLAASCELIVVDGSSPEVFSANRVLLDAQLTHIELDHDLRGLSNGKVAGVITGLRRASSDYVIVADDDVRYDARGVASVLARLEHAEVVRPQNYFSPLPWHACLDTARTLVNRVSGGDWPGTLGIRKHALPGTGYDGNVLFENLELVRTITAAGGREVIALDLFVRRMPPATAHFWSQRVRQAYDEFARPIRLITWLSLLPAAMVLVATNHSTLLGFAAMAIIAAAEIGRQRGGGRRVFPWYCAVAAPLWIAERAMCAWVAVVMRLTLGGIPYRGRVIVRAATPYRQLRQRMETRAG